MVQILPQVFLRVVMQFSRKRFLTAKEGPVKRHTLARFFLSMGVLILAMQPLFAGAVTITFDDLPDGTATVTDQ
jgi:hypothetical protein